MIVETLKVQKALLLLLTNQMKKQESTDKVDFMNLNLHPKKGEILVIQISTGSSITHNYDISVRACMTLIESRSVLYAGWVTVKYKRSMDSKNENMVRNEKAEFAVKMLLEYANENGINGRDTTDLSPLEQWLILRLYNVVGRSEQLVAFGIWLDKNDKHLENGNITETVKEYLEGN